MKQRNLKMKNTSLIQKNTGNNIQGEVIAYGRKRKGYQ